MTNRIHRSVPVVPIHRDAGQRDSQATGTAGGTRAGTVSLKALADRVFDRDRQRDSDKDALPPKTPLSRSLSRVSEVSRFSQTVRNGTAGQPDPEEYEERAAIIEFDGGYRRDEAERRAREETTHNPDERTNT